jgi:DNA mismatch repair ATPase MutS
MQLADLEAIYPNAKNYHLQVEHDRMKLRPTFMYTLKEGPTDLKFGLVLAEIAGFPPDAVAAAREIHRKLQQSDTAKKEKEAQHLRELSQLAQRLLNLKTSTLSPGTLSRPSSPNPTALDWSADGADEYFVVFLTELLRRYLTNLKEKFIAAQHEE